MTSRKFSDPPHCAISFMNVEKETHNSDKEDVANQGKLKKKTADSWD